MRMVVAGAGGAIGQLLVLLLIRRDHRVVAMTRSRGKAAVLREMGAHGIAVDALDA